MNFSKTSIKTAVSNQFLHDNNVDAISKAVMCVLLSYSGEDLTIESLISKLDLTEKQIEKSFYNLEENGYLLNNGRINFSDNKQDIEELRKFTDNNK